jgi:hypothetical protein
MATNKFPWKRNLFGATEPLFWYGKFQAGATQAVKSGEILELSGGNWIPLASDKSMAAIIAVAYDEIKVGDLAGYYTLIVPRPGDVFEFALAAAGATAQAASLYWSDSQTLTVTAGTNIIGAAYGQKNVPPQGHAASDASGDRGTTLLVESSVEMMFDISASYFAALNLA